MQLLIGDLHRYMNVDRIIITVTAVIALCYFLFSLLQLPTFVKRLGHQLDSFILQHLSVAGSNLSYEEWLSEAKTVIFLFKLASPALLIVYPQLCMYEVLPVPGWIFLAK